MPRFLRFRAFFAGVVGRCSSKKLPVDDTPSAVSGLLARKSAAKEWLDILGMGDSGEGPGEGSVTEDESMVEIVVVGELSEDAVELLSRESWWLWKDEKGAPCIVFPLEVRCATLLPCAVLGSRSEVWVWAMLCGSPPKTAPNEGMGMYVLEVVAGMLGSCGDEAARRGWARVVLDRRVQCTKVCSGFLDGKEGLCVDEGLLEVVMSAWCSVVGVGEADMAARGAVSRRAERVMGEATT